MLHGDSKAKIGAINEIIEKTSLNIQDPLTLFKQIKRWKLSILKKQELGLNLEPNESSLVDCLGIEFGDQIDAEMLALSEDSSRFDLEHLQVVIPGQGKRVLANAVAAKHDIVFGSNQREIAHFWVEALEEVMAIEGNVICQRPALLQRAFFAWIFEAWQKRMGRSSSSGFLSPLETTMLDLAVVKKSAHDSTFDSSCDASSMVVQDPNDLVDMSEAVQAAIVKDILGFKDLMQSDKALFWTLALKMTQAFGVNCDSPSRLFLTFLTWRLKAQQKKNQDVPNSAYEKLLFELLPLFGIMDVHVEDAEDDGDDVFEEENLWDKLTADISVKARMAILDTLDEHREIIATRKRSRWDNDRYFENLEKSVLDTV